MTQDEKCLTKRILEEFGGRKHYGRLSVVTDLNGNGEIYPVPHKEEHIEFCIELVRDIRKLERVIPSHIEYTKVEDKYKITSIITGETGMEQGYGIRHDKEDIKNAHQKVLEFVNNGEVLLNSEIESKIIYNHSI